MVMARVDKLGTVCIVGPGLIGGSIGLGLKKKGLAELVIGVGRRSPSLTKALKLGAIDRATQDIEKGASDADIVILCTSVRLIPQMAAKAVPVMKRGAILTDVGSTKQHIVKCIQDIKRKDIPFIGGHPIAGSERRGIEAAKADLFEGRLCILTPAGRNAGALRTIKALWQGLGAKINILSPDEHDRTLAATSHLPLILAASLVNTVGAKRLPYTGPGFRDMTRIASSDPELWCDILLQNRRKVLDALKLFQKELNSIKLAIHEEKPARLSSQLMRAKRLRDAL